MVRPETPGVDAKRAGRGQGGPAVENVPAVLVIPDDRPAFEPPHPGVVQPAGGIAARSAGHGLNSTRPGSVRQESLS